MKRNRRAGVEDRWNKTVIEADGTKRTAPSVRDGKGLRWMARYVDAQGREHTKSFAVKSHAQSWLDTETASHVTGTWTDPKLSAVTFGEVAEKWQPATCLESRVYGSVNTTPEMAYANIQSSSSSNSG